MLYKSNDENKKIDILMGFYLIILYLVPSSINFVLVAFLAVILFIEKDRINISRFFAVMLIYIAINIFSCIYAINVFNAIKEITTWVVFLLALCLGTNINIAHGCKWLKCVLLGIVLVNGYYILSVLCGIDVPMIRIPTINCLAFILYLGIVLAEYLRKQSKQNLLILVEGFYLVGIVLTDSRAIIAIVALYYLYLFIFKYKLNRQGMLAAFVILLCSVLMLAFSESAKDLIDMVISVFDSNNYSNNVRSLLYGEVFRDTLNNHMFLGIGAGNFIDAYPYMRSFSFNSAHAHSIFLQPFVELGIIGFFGTLAVVLAPLLKAIKLEDDYRSAFLEIYIPFIVYGSVDYLWGDSRVGIVMFILIGQLWAVTNPSQTWRKNEKE